MFGTKAHRTRPETIAHQAWENLASAMGTAESRVRTARRRAESLYGDTASRLTSGGREARRRAQNAYDALAGRRHRTSWGWYVAVGLAGVAAGFAATAVGRRALLNGDPARMLERQADEFARLSS